MDKFIDRAVKKFNKQFDALLELARCFSYQEVDAPKDIVALMAYAYLIKTKKSDLGTFMAMTMGSFELTFHNVMHRNNITFNNYYVEPEVNCVW